ncbi:MAG: FAD-dependent monooxygenase [Ignavibacteriales bacterium]|nr:MAG: FAD-dependent monooxygenase [Ignavibacteriales bacterium]
MKQQIEIVVPPDKIGNRDYQKLTASQKLKIPPEEITAVVPIKRSIDARRKEPVYRILVDVYVNEESAKSELKFDYKNVEKSKSVIIVGSGPAGLFAALKLIELGIKPVIIERGKDVQSRRRDLRAIQQESLVNPDSNYCFGEGGAGTYSDGKLYTRSNKRGDVNRILDIFINHGADTDIRVDAHPHIGSNKLPKIVQSIRETIINHGGEIDFNERVTDFIVNDSEMKGVVTNTGKEFVGEAVILATGHSAKDIFYLLHKHNIFIEPKPFAMGVRIEHPQKLIDEIQFHSPVRNENLPAASYTLKCEVGERGVFSFCMCPGGIIVPSATANDEVVVNGMSLSRRDSPFANSGFVVEVTENEWKNYESEFPFSGLKLQMELEQKAFLLAEKSQRAPAQRVTDFVKGKISSTLPDSSYIPGLTTASLHKELPDFISSRLKTALNIFNKKMKGYYTEEAILVGVESRTSSPIRIPRDRETLMHTNVSGLFPCGEGAGYAGGIVSAAIDGENSAEAVRKLLTKKL